MRRLGQMRVRRRCGSVRGSRDPSRSVKIRQDQTAEEEAPSWADADRFEEHGGALAAAGEDGEAADGGGHGTEILTELLLTRYAPLVQVSVVNCL